jgi:hypothetical protein
MFCEQAATDFVVAPIENEVAVAPIQNAKGDIFIVVHPRQKRILHSFQQEIKINVIGLVLKLDVWHILSNRKMSEGLMQFAHPSSVPARVPCLPQD